MSKSKSENVKRWRKNTKQKLVTAMGGCCVICGYNKCNNALELHHIDPTLKELSFGQITANPRKWSVIVAEAKKCILLCSNCHKEVHYFGVELPDCPTFIEPDDPIYQKDMRDECPVCGGDKIITNKTCSSKCAGSLKCKVDIPNKDDLLAELKEMSFSAVGRKYDVSDNAVRKWCVKYGLPRTAKDIKNL